MNWLWSRFSVVIVMPQIPQTSRNDSGDWGFVQRRRSMDDRHQRRKPPLSSSSSSSSSPAPVSSASPSLEPCSNSRDLIQAHIDGHHQRLIGNRSRQQNRSCNNCRMCNFPDKRRKSMEKSRSLSSRAPEAIAMRLINGSSKKSGYGNVKGLQEEQSMSCPQQQQHRGCRRHNSVRKWNLNHELARSNSEPAILDVMEREIGHGQMMKGEVTSNSCYNAQQSASKYSHSQSTNSVIIRSNYNNLKELGVNHMSDHDEDCGAPIWPPRLSETLLSSNLGGSNSYDDIDKLSSLSCEHGPFIFFRMLYAIFVDFLCNNSYYKWNTQKENYNFKKEKATSISRMQLVTISLSSNINFVRILVRSDASLRTVMQIALHSFASQQNLLSSDFNLDEYELHFSAFSLQCLDLNEKVENLGARRFVILHKSNKSHGLF